MIIRFLIRFFVSLAVGFFFIWWISRNVEMGEVRALISQVDPYPVFLALMCYGFAIFLRIYRWKRLLLFFTPLNFWQVARALVVGYAMNIILPARLGELFRVNICKSWYSVPRSAALASIVWERLSDGIVVVCCLIVGAVSLGNIESQGEIRGLMASGCLVFVSAALGLAFLRNISLHRILQKWPSLLARASIFQKGVQDLSVLALIQMMAMSLLIWFFEGLSLWSIARASGIALSGVDTCLLIGVVSLSTLLPSPPGFLGTMQFAFVISFLASGHASTAAVLAASMNQLFLLGTLAALGIVLYGWISLKNKGLRYEQ